MVGPNFIDRKPQASGLSETTEGPWQVVLEALQNASDQKTVKAALIVLYTARQQLTMDGRRDKEAQVAGNFIDAITKKIVNESMDYSRLKDYLSEKLVFAQQKAGEQEITPGPEKKDDWYEEAKDIKETGTSRQKAAQDFVQRYSNLVLSLVDPAALHASRRQVEADLPYPLKVLETDLRELVRKFDRPEDAFAEIRKIINEYYGTESATGKLLLSALEKNSSDSFFASIMQLNRVQKAIDGLNALVKSKSFGLRGMASQDFDVYFGELNLPSKTKEFILSDRKSGSLLKSAIEDVFSAIGDAKYRQESTRFALEVNYGENCAILDKLLEWVGGSTASDPVEKAKNFFLAIASSTELESAWKHIKKKFGSTANELLSAEQKTPNFVEDNVAIFRGRYDLATLVSFAYASSKSSFLQRGSFTDSQAKLLLQTISGVSPVNLPTPVPCTMLQNYGALDAIYQSFEGSYDSNGLPQAFFSVASELTNRVAGKYSLPFGAMFNMKYGTLSRKEAADLLLRKVEELKDNKVLLDDLMVRLLKNTNPNDPPSIQIRPIHEQVLVVPQYADVTNIRKTLEQYHEEDQPFDKVDAQRRSTERFLDLDAPNPEMRGVDKSSYYSQLLTLPQTYISGISAIDADIMSTGETLRVDNVRTDVDITGRKDQNTRISGYGDVKISTNQNGYINAFYKQDVNQVYDYKTGSYVTSQDMFENATVDAKNLRMSRFQIYDLFATWYKRKQDEGDSKTLELQEVSANELFLMRTKGFMPAGDFALYYARGINDTEKFRTADAYLNMGGKWFRFAHMEDFINSSEGREAAGLDAKQNYAAAYYKTGNMAFYNALESRKIDIIKTGLPDGLDAIGGVIGMGNVRGDNRFGTLYIQTPSGNKAFGFSYGTGMNSGNPTVVTGAYMFFKQDELDAYTKTFLQDKSNINYIQPKHVAMASWMTNKFYAMVLGGSTEERFKLNVLGGKVMTKYGGFGALVQYNSGQVDSFFLNGSYVHSDIGVSLVMEGGKHKATYTNGTLSINLGKGYELIFNGVSKTRAMDFKENFEALATDIENVANDMQNTLAQENWSVLDEGAKHQKLEEYKNRIAALLQVAKTLGPEDAFANAENEFSVMLKTPTVTNKFSIATIKDSPGSQDYAYALNMTSFDLGGNKSLSLTIGAPIGAGQGNLKELIGGKVRLGDFAFGVVGYNLFTDKPVAIQTTVAYDFGNDLLAKLSVKVSKEGHMENIYIGNRKIDLAAANVKWGDLSSQEIAFRIGIGANPTFFVGLNGQMTRASQGDFERFKVEVPITWYPTDSRASLQAKLFYDVYHMGGVRNSDFGVKATFSINF